MLVWQSSGEQSAVTHAETDGRALARSYEWPEEAVFPRSRRPISRRTRVALEYSLAIVSALILSYLILSLGL